MYAIAAEDRWLTVNIITPRFVLGEPLRNESGTLSWFVLQCSLWLG